MSRDELCNALRSRWYLTADEIDAILADQGYFHPYLRDALAKRAQLGCVPESSIDATDCSAIFLLTELGDESVIPDILQCLRMSEEDLRLLYADTLTEHMWLPFAKLGSTYLENLWEFVTDTSVYLFARHAAVAGVVAVHHFYPDKRSAAVAFVERLLERNDCFPVDHLAGILCDCADSGLMELAGRAEEFVSAMREDQEKSYPMATADDVLRSFKKGARKDFISGRPHNVYGVNKQWQKWDEAAKKEETDDELVAMENEDESGEFFDTEPSKPKQMKIGRNDACPCGSGKKYKKCHGA
jgi:hypothetical protein